MALGSSISSGTQFFYNNSWPTLPARLIVNDTNAPRHPSPALHFTAPINEWYGWQPDPRHQQRRKSACHPRSCRYPLGKKDILHPADIPVVWTNTRYHMLYMNMGHGDQILSSPVQNRLFEDAINWLGARG